MLTDDLADLDDLIFDDDYLFEDYSTGLGETLINETITGDDKSLQLDLAASARSIRREARHRMKRADRRENLREVLTELPDPGWSVHVLGCNKFDAWTWIPHSIELMGGRADELLINTWIISSQHAKELVYLIRSGNVGRTTVMTGLLFKGKDPAAYALLVEELAKHDGRYLAVLSHAKITLLANKNNNQYITIESSANLSTNEKVEQTAVHNDRNLYDWYKGWFDGVFENAERKLPLW